MKHILVIGDAFVDRYIYGRATRLSPEAPVAVLQYDRETASPGGAGNTAYAVKRLGGVARIVAVCGGPSHGGSSLADVTYDHGIPVRDMVRSEGRGAQIKTRFITDSGGAHQLLRVDREKTGPYSEDTQRQIHKAVQHAMIGAGFVVVSDYAKGLINRDLMEVVYREARRINAPVLVDPKPVNVSCYRGTCDIVAPNRAELAEYVKRRLATVQDIEAAAIDMGSDLGAHTIFAKADRLGAVVATRLGLHPVVWDTHHFETTAKNVIDVTGAGDVAVAAFAVGCMQHDMNLAHAAKFAMKAAAVAVSNSGTYCPKAEEV